MRTGEFPTLKPAHEPTLLEVQRLIDSCGGEIDLADLHRHWPTVNFNPNRTKATDSVAWTKVPDDRW